MAGVGLNRSSIDQLNNGARISEDQLRPGDLIVYSAPNHVAIYIGNGNIVHAKNAESGIVIDNMRAVAAPIVGFVSVLP